MSTTGEFPSLSELLAWPTEHLSDGADFFEATAAQWYEVFNHIWQDSLSVDWEGTSAETLHLRTYTDKATVSGAVDQLHEAAMISRIGTSDLDAARSRVRYAVEDAGEARFVVGEDLSVSDRSTGGNSAELAARQTQAQVLAKDIRQRAAQLVGLDQQIGGRISATLAMLRTLSFDNAIRSDADESSSTGHDSSVQLVDYTEGPSTVEGGFPPLGPHLIYCSPGPGGQWWCEGWDYNNRRPYTFLSPFDLSGVA